MHSKCWLLRRFLWPIAETVRKTKYCMKLKLLSLFWHYIVVISPECAKTLYWEGLFRKSAFAQHNEKLTTLEWFLLPSFFLDCVRLWNGKVFDQTWAKPLADGRCREEGRGAGNSSAGGPHPFLMKVIAFVRGACPHSIYAWKKFTWKLLQAGQGFVFLLAGVGRGATGGSDLF